MNKNFIRVRSTQDLIIAASVMAAGLLISTIFTDDIARMSGCFLAFVGVMLALYLKTGYKDSKTGIRYKKTEKNFPLSMRESIAAAIVKNPNSIDVSQADKSNAIKIDIYFSKTNGMAYLQMFEYVPYEYEARTGILEYEISKASSLIK